jgi:hypothetical protein
MATHELPIDEIFQRMDDFSLCNVISGAVGARYGYDFLMTWPASVPLAHRVMHFAWLSTGFLECEGLARFFNLHCNHSAYPECFDILGLPSLATGLRNLLALFPKCDLGDTDALISHFGSWKRIEELVDSTESELYASSDSIQSVLASYARHHKTEFEPLLPEIRMQREYEKLTERMDG